MFQVTLVESRFVILHVLLETSMDRAIMICRYGTLLSRSCLFALKKCSGKRWTRKLGFKNLAKMIPFRNVSPFKFFYTFQESKCPTLHKNLQYKGTEKKIKNDTYTVISHVYISLFQLQGRQNREDPNDHRI